MKTRLLKFAGGLMLIFASMAVFAQDPPPPPGGGHGQTTNQTPGGSAPIGSGIALLLGMAALYGGKKVYDARKKLME
ncbi:MAG: hypothetical protein WHT22_01230 [Bacteroidales bacterium]